MEQALYRKYRSHTLDEIVGQKHITETLKKALKSGKLSHAYLFTGPRGVGKTSVARILAHEVNRLPYKDDSLHLDIIEIDAASNRRIDEIRDLRERVHIAPTSAKYKIYIIDEVHMLTREAFNALLKTLEEPPAHCIFILATTEAYKLPETIVSRTQRFSFKPIRGTEAAEHLASIAKREHIKIKPEALQLLAEHGEGSFRDSIGMLDQLAASGQAVTEETVRQLLGLPPANVIAELLRHLSQGQTAQSLGDLEKLWEYGASPTIVASELAKQLRAQILDAQAEKWSISLLRQLLSVSTSPKPSDQLEIAVLEAANQQSLDKGDPDIPGDTTGKRRSASSPSPPKHATPKLEISKSVGRPVSFSLDQWPAIVDEIKTSRASLYTALRLAQPQLEDNTLTLAFQFGLHQRKINQSEHRKLLEDLINARSDGQVKVVCVVDKKAQSKKTPLAAELDAVTLPSGELHAINSIFGQAEMLEF